MRWSRPLPTGRLTALFALLLALPAGQASAGSCCIGATTAMPGRAGACENWVIGLASSGETGIGQWSSAGVFGPSSLEESSGKLALGAAWRFTHRAQVALSVPAQVTFKRAGTQESSGGGPGDLRAAVIFNPLEEPADSERVPVELLPVPYLTIGVRMPTGTSWEASSDALLADVTGLPGAALLVGASLERTLGRVAWTLGIDAEVPLDALSPDATSSPRIATSASLGHYIGHRWSVVGSARYAWTPPDPAAHSVGTAQTSVGARAVYGLPMSWRAWAGVDSSLPVSSLGRASPAVVSVSLGWALVR